MVLLRLCALAVCLLTTTVAQATTLLHLCEQGLVVHAPPDITAPCVAIMTHCEDGVLTEYGVYLDADEEDVIPAAYVGGDLLIEFWQVDSPIPDINLTVGGMRDEDADGDNGTDADIGLFLSWYSDGMTEADFNRDGEVDPDDLAAFFGGL